MKLVPGFIRRDKGCPCEEITRLRRTRGPVISGKVSPLVPSLSCHVTSGLWPGPSHDFLVRYSHESTSGSRFIAGQLLDIRAIKTPACTVIFPSPFVLDIFLWKNVKEASVVNPLLIINGASVRIFGEIRIKHS